MHVYILIYANIIYVGGGDSRRSFQDTRDRDSGLALDNDILFFHMHHNNIRVWNVRAKRMIPIDSNDDDDDDDNWQ